MIEKKQMEEELFQYLNDIIELRNKFGLYKMIKINVEGSIDKVNNYSYIFVTIIRSLMYSFFMESYKLFHNKEEKNVYKMIELCKNNKIHFNNDDKLFINLNGLNKLLLENAEKLKNIECLRDKYFAHNDKKYFIEPSRIFEDYMI